MLTPKVHSKLTILKIFFENKMIHNYFSMGKYFRNLGFGKFNFISVNYSALCLFAREYEVHPKYC